MSERDVIAHRLTMHPAHGITPDARKKADAILAALSAAGLVVEQGWQPIETAPRDAVAGGIWGPWLRLYRRGVVPLSGHWFHDSATRGWWVAAGKPFSPTHWRPIEAPQEDK